MLLLDIPPIIEQRPIRTNWCTAAKPPDNNIIANLTMASERNTICNDNMIADHTIMTYMRIGHKQIIRADNGLTACLGAPVKGNTLPDNIPVTNMQIGLFAGKLEILWFSGKHSSGMDPALAADSRT